MWFSRYDAESNSFIIKDDTNGNFEAAGTFSIRNLHIYSARNNVLGVTHFEARERSSLSPYQNVRLLRKHFSTLFAIISYRNCASTANMIL